MEKLLSFLLIGFMFLVLQTGIVFAEVQSFSSPVYPFSFTYPESLKIEAKEAETSVVLTRDDPVFYMDLSVIPVSDPAVTLDPIIDESIKNFINSGFTIMKKETTTVCSIPAQIIYMSKVEDEVDVDLGVIFFERNNVKYLATVSTIPELIDTSMQEGFSILNSLQFKDSQPATTPMR